VLLGRVSAASARWQSGRMAQESKQVAILIDRPVTEVYEYVFDPVHLPEWAAGLGEGVTNVEGQWYVETTAGRLGLEFVSHNDFGVLDHYVTMPSGEVFYNPMRVFANDGGTEVVFTVRRSAGMSDDDFENDAQLVAADLERLKSVLEGRR
jgi:hypothetical protein